MKRSQVFILVAVGILLLLFPQIAYATVESTLNNFASVLASRILPLIAVLGLVYAGFSFVTGNPGAKNHFIYACLGVAVGLCAKSIIDLVKTMVQ